MELENTPGTTAAKNLSMNRVKAIVYDSRLRSQNEYEFKQCQLIIRYDQEVTICNGYYFSNFTN